MFGRSRDIGEIEHRPALSVIDRQVHDLPILATVRLLELPANAASGAINFFATSEMLELSGDKAWLIKVTKEIKQH